MQQPFDELTEYQEFLLPTTEKEFDEIVDEVLRRFPQITERDHAVAVISVAIRHLPNDQATTTFRYLGHAVLKSLANHVANFKGERVKHETQVAQCFNLLTSDPFNMQARDALEKWANEGSIPAKDALARLEPKKDTNTEAGANVLPIKAV